ncbi:MAG: cytochrome c oxidase subunit 3 [Nevskiaceae bacterium]|nr:MAG: cytochrome c oxidase subunit 3 [Nevskiaceae bacterium]TBR73154.1 MAG: cytochrome c oxidase subunit 3 [Nevskiaceae bacterium]
MEKVATNENPHYFVPTPVPWPFILLIGITLTIFGFGHWLEGYVTVIPWKLLVIVGPVIFFSIVFRWFWGVVHESERGAYNRQVDMTYRMGMGWFIFSEVCFFGAFFGALFYTHVLSIPWLGGEGAKFFTGSVLWPDFTPVWPSNGPGAVGGEFEAMAPWGLAAINTVLLVTSSFTLTWAHHALKDSSRAKCIAFMILTVALGLVFLSLQAYEYHEAYTIQNLTLHSGVYGSTFFMLTGFHGLHVTIGTIMLIVITCRLFAGHFTPERHFGFEGVAWYWHFVDVVWILLFTFVYIL